MRNRMFSAVFLGIVLAVCTTSAGAESYTIDSAHTTVGFKIKHMAISTVTGQFADFGGTFSYNPKDVKSSKVAATIKAPSISTQHQKRDDHLRGSDFFDVLKFPEISFVSKEILDPSAESFKVRGDLTIRGVTKPVTLDVTFGGAAKDPWGNEKIAFSATTKINRRDFGLTWSKLLETGALVVGDEVAINLEVEGTKTKT
ncbi:MAG: polyisoprenoid-binding protein [Proteobacteria bacterium]|nr:polyisoprenoid-binding protein [Pseudomonadota bacterium]